MTGSNSTMLSSDILTEFRGRSNEIRVHLLRFAEYYSAVGGDKNEAFDEYAVYGGMPLILSRPNEADKMNYLKSLFAEVYIKDIVERRKIERQDVLEQILDLLCSSIGSLTNPAKIAGTLNSKQIKGVSSNTIRAYIEHLKDAFLFLERKRYNVKGKSYGAVGIAADRTEAVRADSDEPGDQQRTDPQIWLRLSREGSTDCRMKWLSVLTCCLKL